jgi:hypothetical protein
VGEGIAQTAFSFWTPKEWMGVRKLCHQNYLYLYNAVSGRGLEEGNITTHLPTLFLFLFFPNNPHG